MKTKNFLLPALAVAMFAAPVIAQDYHEYENEIRDSITENVVENTRQHKYLDLGFLRAAITEDLTINIDEIKTAAANSIKDNKIEPIYQYDIMVVSIENNRNDILRALLEAGFDKELGEQLGLNSLPAKAVEYDNVEAFALTFTFGNKEKTAQVLEELEKLDPALTNRFFDFVKKCESTGLKKTINKFDRPTLKKLEKPHGEILMKVGHNFSGGAHISKPLVKDPIKVENEYGEEIGTIYSDPRTNITVIDYSNSAAISVPSGSSMRTAPQEKGYVIDTVPAATATIKVESNTETNSSKSMKELFNRAKKSTTRQYTK